MASAIGIRRVRVKGLFNLYNYALPRASSFDKLVIFYGDNGSGKTTVLQLLFHLVSAANNRGHRSALLRVPFKSLIVDVAGGVELAATRPDGVKGSLLILTIRTNGKLISRWDFADKDVRPHSDALESLEGFDVRVATRRLLRHLSPNSLNLSEPDVEKQLRNSKIDPSDLTQSFAIFRTEAAEKDYHKHLSELNLTLFLMSADRELLSDTLAVQKPEDDYAAFLVKYRNAQAVGEERLPGNEIASTRDRYLTAALDEAYRWISQKAVTATNIGSQNANDWYFNLISNLVVHSAQRGEEALGIEEIQSTLASFDERATRYARLELFPAFKSKDLINLVTQAQKSGQFPTVQRVLASFISTLRARLDALDPIYSTISSVLEIVNSLFSRKKLEFTLTRGFYFLDSNGAELRSQSLSSGEKHLLLIVFRALVASENPTVFLIDEPEISLNVKWQRRLVGALSQLIGMKPMQLIFATHSFEILSQHEEAVAQLISDDDIGSVHI